MHRRRSICVPSFYHVGGVAIITALEGYEFLQTVLKADPVLQASALGTNPRVYQDNAPEGIPAYPFLLLRYVVGIPTLGLGAVNVWTPAIFDVLIVTRDNSRMLVKPIINRVDVVLQGKSGRTTDGEVFFCRIAPDRAEIVFPDPPSPGGGARIQNVGRSWELTIRGTG